MARTACVDYPLDFIRRHNVDAKIVDFGESVETVDAASRVVGVQPSEIVKTLLLVVDGRPLAVLLPGDKKLDYRKLSALTKASKIRMASPDEITELTSLMPGGLTPLSECIRGLRVVMDSTIESKERVWVGGGSPTALANVSVKDLIRVLRPVRADVSQ
ncbi:MAG: aminoacyl-tRNA deacylase [Acidilobus sp.]